MDDQNDTLEQKVLDNELEIPESAMVEYKPNPLRVGAEIIGRGVSSVLKGLYIGSKCYVKGFLPTDIQQKKGYTSVGMNNTVNFYSNVVLTGGASYYFLNGAVAFLIGCSGLFFVGISRGIYYDLNKRSLAFLPSEGVYALTKYISGKYKDVEQQLIKTETLKSLQEKKTGTLSLPASGEEGQLSLEDKTGAVSITYVDNNYDSSLF